MSKKQSVVPVDLAQRVCAVRARARIASLLLILVGMPASAWAAKAPLPLPRFATFRSSEVNVRVGPGREYPVEWTYYRANLPVEIFQEYDVWRHIRDAEGTEGWVHQSVLSGKRHVMVMGTSQAIRAEPDEQAKPVAQLEPGVIAKILKCNEGYCQVQVQGYSGWIGKEHLWGVYASELIK